MARTDFFDRNRKILTWIVGGFLGAVIFLSRSGWERWGLVSDLLFVLGIMLVGVATVGRLWCLLYLAGYKTRMLITTGPYSACRNPLYFFSLVGGIGLGLANEMLVLALVIGACFAVYYPLVIRAEERKLRGIHGAAFEDYVNRVPRFWPSLKRVEEPEEYMVRPRNFRRGLFDAMWFVWLVGILELIEALHEYDMIPSVMRLY